MNIVKKNGIHITKADSLLITPYIFDEKLGNYVLGENTYDLKEIIGNSIEITQDDSDVTNKIAEYSATPILQNIVKGKWNFSSKCIDFCNAVMKEIYGFIIGMDENNEQIPNSALFTQNSKPIYVFIRVNLRDRNISDIVLPKVLLNPNISINNLKNGFAIGDIKGESIEEKIMVSIKQKAINYGTKNNPIYSLKSSLLFVPKGFQVSVFREDMGNYEMFTKENDGVIVKLDVVSGILK